MVACYLIRRGESTHKLGLPGGCSVEGLLPHRGEPTGPLTGGDWNPLHWHWREMLTVARIAGQLPAHPASNRVRRWAYPERLRRAALSSPGLAEVAAGAIAMGRGGYWRPRTTHALSHLSGQFLAITSSGDFMGKSTWR